jgi:hypothetical protein
MRHLPSVELSRYAAAFTPLFSLSPSSCHLSQASLPCPAGPSDRAGQPAIVADSGPGETPLVGAREAVALTVRDQRGPLGLDGLGAALPPLRQGPLGPFRRRLMAHNLDNILLERTIAWAEQTGGGGARQRRAALASTPLFGAGRVEDTLPLLGHAGRKAVGRAARARGASAEARLEEAGLVLVGPSSLKAALALDWGQPQAREQALRLVREEGDRWQKWLEQPQCLSEDAPPMPDVMDPIAQMVTPDPAPDQEGGPGGKRIKQQGAPGRRSAIEDADMRPGRKSSATPCNGFQAPFVLDVDRPGTREGVVRPANEPAPEVVEMLVETWEQPPGLLQLAIALASMARPRRAPGAAQGVSSMARPWPQGGTRLRQDDVTFACAHGHVTCPGGQTVPMVPGQDAQFPASAGDRGPQRVQCTPAKSGPGRSLALREDAQCQHTLRAKITTKRGRAWRRKRTAVEHALSHH